MTSGWRFSLITGVASVLVVFIINFSTTLWALKLPTGGEAGDTTTTRRIIYEGPCTTSKKLNVVLHLLINIFSCVLLSASSYGMQCLSAPTRAEVDRAHAREEWMDIGVLSVRNLGKVSCKRTFFWVLLGIFSVPLHLLFNSVVFASISIFDYTAHNIDELVRWNASSRFTRDSDDLQMGELFQRALKENWDNPTSLECIDAYATGFQTARSDVIVVCDGGSDVFLERIYDREDVSLYPGMLRGYCRPSPFDWICEEPDCSLCHDLIADVRKQPENWKPFGYQAKYCLSKPVRQLCRVSFSVFIAGAVLGANIIKAGVLIYVAFNPPEQPLFVLGGAIQTFPETPEPGSKSMRLVSIDRVKNLGTRGCTGPTTSSLRRRR
ncbi:uncharacterized protein NECHADRAFT_88281 [Fusarium vanettenii 77-13-4]|uniref:DUF6536 domain-containing protein n=1 Tax=Fusarium vanettenii (strain ATCC MYA-4622 / CBS 123669 / FGSC 9596 / NRRL 45880 / 77-13-4) TaxID=660122 RepID=C7ZE13_FUSV7|nr:uncharacterized protein NECHADRAFT_88281 [Fusarium vanettenii 77-13-4]EEU37939.1 hypothetical protein NECHADRAFT_88281 [Fusarium vanettenii 77-13-4]